MKISGKTFRPPSVAATCSTRFRCTRAGTSFSAAARLSRVPPPPRGEKTRRKYLNVELDTNPSPTPPPLTLYNCRPDRNGDDDNDAFLFATLCSSHHQQHPGPHLSHPPSPATPACVSPLPKGAEEAAAVHPALTKQPWIIHLKDKPCYSHLLRSTCCAPPHPRIVLFSAPRVILLAPLATCLPASTFDSRLL